MKITNLIDAEYFYDNTTFEKNIDDAKINPVIKRAQDMYIATILGSDFYNYLMDVAYEYVENGVPLSNDDEVLITEYIQPALTYWAAYLAVTPLRVKATNKSMSQENSQYSQSSMKSDVQELKAEYRQAAEFYTQRLVKYLCDYKSNYPIYENPSDKENLKKTNVAYNSGFYISKKNRDNGCCGF